MRDWLTRLWWRLRYARLVRRDIECGWLHAWLWAWADGGECFLDGLEPAEAWDTEMSYMDWE